MSEIEDPNVVETESESEHESDHESEHEVDEVRFFRKVQCGTWKTQPQMISISSLG